MKSDELNIFYQSQHIINKQDYLQNISWQWWIDANLMLTRGMIPFFVCLRSMSKDFHSRCLRTRF